jgi:VIT1/CCC1 family predicted Fe2+/Mn2+ transporter
MAKKTSDQKKSSSSRAIGLPVLVETVFTLTKLTATLVGIIVIIVSLAHGNPYWMAILRGGVTVFTLGLLGWFIAWFSTKGVIESVSSMLKEADEIESFSSNSMDTNA